MAAVCAYCSASSRIDPGYLELATAVGTALGRRGHSLVSGGGDVSMMGAIARSARAAGARTVGVIPQALLAQEVGDRDSDELLVVEDMRTRKGLMDARSDAFLALPGGLGTLEELLEVWVARSLDLHRKPVVALDPDGLFAPLRDQVTLLVERGFLRREAADVLRWAGSVDEALELIEQGLAAPLAARPEPAEALEFDP